ncbi:ascc3, partial [Symbiodinium sp. CCMP2456]
NLFYFDSSYRPIPLETSFLGITELSPQHSGVLRTNRVKHIAKLNEICYEAVVEQVRKGVPPFVSVSGDVGLTVSGSVFLTP